MSIVRISALKSAVHGVHPDGAFVHEPYDRRTLLGRTEPLVPPERAPGPGERMRPGDRFSDWREADRRGFPRDGSDLSHLVRGLVGPKIEKLRDGPVVVMVHGFLFDPRDAVSARPADSDNPHSRLYHFVRDDEAEEIRRHTASWPLGLGFREDCTDGRDGLALAYAWHSRPGFASSLITQFQNFYARAYENAEEAAWTLAGVLHVLVPLLPPGKPVDIFCHSLGSRVVVRLIALLVKHGREDILSRLGRVVILGGAEYVVEARLMLSRLGRPGDYPGLCFYNIVSRENDVLDKLGENFGPVTFGNSNVIGHNGLDVQDPASLGNRWLDIQIDSRDVAEWLRTNRGVEVTGDDPSSIWDHWHYYCNRRNMDLYHGILRAREQWVISELRTAGMPDKVSRQRSIFGD